MYGALDISVSGMIAQRTRIETLTANMVNANALEDGQHRFNPYLRRHVLFAPGDPSASTDAGRAMGVHVSEIFADPNSLTRKHMPESKWADSEGYVMAPDISPVVEYMNMMEASRAYEANVAAAEATKSMVAQALRLLA